MTKATEIVDTKVRMTAKMREDMHEIAKREFSTFNREMLVAARAHIDAHKRGKK